MGKRLNKISGETGDARTLRKSPDGFFLRVHSIPELVVRESVPVSPEILLKALIPFFLTPLRPPSPNPPRLGASGQNCTLPGWECRTGAAD